MVHMNYNIHEGLFLMREQTYSAQFCYSQGLLLDFADMKRASGKKKKIWLLLLATYTKDVALDRIILRNVSSVLENIF